MTFRITAVIPVYNGAEFLRDAIESVRLQERAVDELIVVDDCSSDLSADLAESLGARCIRQPLNAGPGAARNRGIEAATGDVIAFLDADDRWLASHCGPLVQPLERHPACAVAFSRIRIFGDESSPGSRIYLAEDTPTPVFWHLLYENIVKQSASVVRRDALVRYGAYNELRRYSEDYELWLHLSRKA